MRAPNGLHLFPALIAAIALSATPSAADPILFGGLGGHNNGDSTNDGSLAIVNPTTGAVTVVGHPAGVSRISGLAFDASGNLYGTTQPAGGFPPPPGPTGASNLIRLNPVNGQLLTAPIPITLGGVGISIADLAVQPGTQTIYGIRGAQDQLGGQGRLYTIDPLTGFATFIGDTGDFFGSIAFAPNGTLYMSAAELDINDNLTNIALKTLNPLNAAVLTNIPAVEFYGALGIRPTDGVIFAGNGDAAQLFTINPATAAETLVGTTGRTFVGDLAFQPIPEPATLTLLAFGLAVVAARGYRVRSVRRASSSGAHQHAGGNL